MYNCPSCGKNNWESQDFVITPSEKSSNDDATQDNVKRIVKQFRCKGCNYVIHIPDEQEQSGKNSFATCGGELGTASSNFVGHSHVNTGNSS